MTTGSQSAAAPMLNSNLNQEQPKAWDKQGICMIADMVKAKLAVAGTDEQRELLSMLAEQILQANQVRLQDLKDKTEKVKDAYMHKDQLDEDYATVTLEIHKSVEAEEASIAELEGEEEELCKELCARMSWGFPKEDVNMIMVPDMSKLGQKPAAKPTWAGKVAGMAAAMEEGAAKETDAPMLAHEHCKLEKAIRLKKVQVPEVYEPPQKKKRMLSEDEQHQALEKFGDQPKWAEAGGLMIITLNKVKGMFSRSFKDICMDLINYLEHPELHVHNISRVMDMTLEVLDSSDKDAMLQCTWDKCLTDAKASHDSEEVEGRGH
ncbi:hypothetical protein FBU31_001063 [Coemansia sp. 'formosensis']|nr:hypothetical protein FBU31_001063 [Coemansia sp. 'formosensis']